MTTIIDHARRSNLGSKIYLYQIDLSMFGEENLYLYEGDEGSTVITYDSVEYAPWPIQAEGFALTTDGSLPRPKISVANASGLFTPLIENNDDLKGAQVTRIITFQQYLDGEADADPEMHYPTDVYFINKKVSHRLDEMVTFELVAAIDLETTMIPNRIVTRESCDLEYRIYDPGTTDFIYTNATCPHIGASFDVDGDSTTDNLDTPSKKLSTCCKPRFGTAGPYPFGGFPGVSRYRRR